MERGLPNFCVSAVILVFMIGIVACENSSSVAENTTDSAVNNVSSSNFKSNFSTSSTVDSTEISLQSGVTNGTADLEAIDNQQGLLTFDATASVPSSLTSLITFDTPSESPSSDPGMMNVPYQVYEHTPQSLSFDGNSQLNYEINGTSYTYNLTGWGLDMTDWMLEFTYYAYVVPAHNKSVAKSNYQEASHSDLNWDAMTPKDIKKWFHKRGYKVENLGNRQFKLTYTVGKNTSHKLFVHSIFDAKTTEIEPMGVSDNNKQLSEILVKKRFGKRKEITLTGYSLYKKEAKKIFMKMISKN